MISRNYSIYVVLPLTICSCESYPSSSLIYYAVVVLLWMSTCMHIVCTLYAVRPRACSWSVCYVSCPMPSYQDRHSWGVPITVFAPALDPKRKRWCVCKAQRRGRCRPCSARFDPIRSSAPAGPSPCADWRRALSASGSVPPAKTVETAQCTGRDQEGKCRCRELLARLDYVVVRSIVTSMGWPGREC